MDPLSISASVVGLLGATAKVSSILTTFIQGVNDAPKLAAGVLQEVSEISACLAQLQAFLVGTKVGTRSRTALIMVEQVVVTLTACVMTFSELEDLLGSLNDTTPTRILSRIKWTRKETAIAKLCLRLSSSRQSLGLMLTTLTCVSVDQATTSVEKLVNVVQDLMRNNQDLCARIGNLESLPANQIIHPTPPESDNEEADDASTIRSLRRKKETELDAAEIPLTGIKRFTFEKDLRQSRVYRRTKKRKSRESLLSSAAPSFGWSCLSETSLANVSNISVISLPIAAKELANAQYYTRLFTAVPGSNNTSQSLASAVSRGAKHSSNENQSRAGSKRPQEIAILGTSLSGKTTIYNQLVGLHSYTYSASLRDAKRSDILDNLLSASLLISFRIDNTEIELETDELESLRTVRSFHGAEFKTGVWEHHALTRYIRAFRDLLHNADVRRLMRLEDSAGWHDNIEYFSSRLESLFLLEGLATDVDIYRARLPLQRASSRFKFTVDDVAYQVTKASESRPGRNQSWRGLYSIADSVVYVAALSGYCRQLIDNNEVNQMQDAMAVFEDVVYSVTVPIVLLFTKRDVLEQNLKVMPFSDFFPEYTGFNGCNMVCAYIATMFQRLHTRSSGKLQIRFVNATDPDNFRAVFRDIETSTLSPQPTTPQSPDPHFPSWQGAQEILQDHSPSFSGYGVAL